MIADIDAGLPAIGSDQADRYPVIRSSAEETAALRRAVLRPHLTIEQMSVAGDQNPDTAYLAVVSPDGDQPVLGCLRLEPAECSWRDALEAPAHAPWQLRAMATDPSVRGTGVGRLLIEAAVQHVACHGGDLIWCNARVSAEQFYVRLGFRPLTGYFVVPDVPGDHLGLVLQVRG